MAVIQLKDIMKTYIMGDSIVHALDHVNVTIDFGEFTAIMGPSGSGKSTMMNILGCLDRPTSGEYYLDGKEIAGYNDDELAHTRNAKIGFVFQNFNLLSKLTAQANVALPLVYAGVGEEERMERAKKAYNIYWDLWHGAKDPTGLGPKTIPETRSGRAFGLPMIYLNVTSVMLRVDPENKALYEERAQGCVDDIFKYNYVLEL